MRSTIVLFCGTVVISLLCACDRAVNRPERLIWFNEEAHERGLHFQHRSGAISSRYWTPEIMTGGVALADFDGDGDLDAFLVQGGELPNSTDSSVTHSDSSRSLHKSHELYLNDGRGFFRKAAFSYVLRPLEYGMGTATGDYDKDGDIDLYVTHWGRNVLLQNQGDATFIDVTANANVGDSNWGTAAVFLDLDADDDLDLYVVNYLHWTPSAAEDCVVTYCAPSPDEATADVLYRNNGDGTFTDVSVQAGLRAAFGNGLGIAGADFNQDGLIDVFVANDGMPNQLWINRGALQFENEAWVRGCAIDEHGIAKAGMGVASNDVDSDGDIDLLVMNLSKQTDSYYRNEGDYFHDATRQVGLGVVSRRYTRFGVALADFNNDGFLDLYEANGRIDHTVIVPGIDPFAEPNVIFQGIESGFSVLETSNGENDRLVHTSRAVAMGDVDKDGGIDLLVVNRDGPVYMLMNETSEEGNWLEFRVRKNGLDAVGAIVELTVIVDGQSTVKRRIVQTGGSYLSSHDPNVHFGIGSVEKAYNVSVEWRLGETENFGDFDANRSYELLHGIGSTP